jgi:monoterpene epsilon-lactone hydrolase
MPSKEHEFVADLLRRGQDVTEPLPLAARRRAFDRFAGRRPLPVGVAVESKWANGVGSEYIWSEESDASRAVLYLHGGGFTMGSLDSHREMAARVAKATQSAVLLLGYRLAPEHPYPAALNDVTAGFRFLLSEGFALNRIALVGDSAGGGLGLAALVSWRDAGEPLPACVVCLSPWLDLTLRFARSLTKTVRDPVNTIEALREAAGCYAASSPLDSPTISPLFADLTGLPEMLVQVGTAELLLAEARSLVANARAVGVKAELDEYEGLIHVFQLLAGGSIEAERALERLGSFVRRCTSAAR